MNTKYEYVEFLIICFNNIYVLNLHILLKTITHISMYWIPCFIYKNTIKINVILYGICEISEKLSMFS